MFFQNSDTFLNVSFFGITNLVTVEMFSYNVISPGHLFQETGKYRIG